MARPELAELDDLTIEAFFTKWVSSATPLAAATAADAARQAAEQPYNSATRIVHVGTDPTMLRLPGATTGNAPAQLRPRFYWRRTPGFDVAIVPRAQPLVDTDDDDDDAADADGQGDDEQADALLREHEDEPLVRLSRVPIRKMNLHFMRELARRRAARSVDDLLTDHTGVTHATAHAACRALGYLDEAEEARHVLQSLMADAIASPAMLRSLFTQFIVARRSIDELIDELGVLDALREPGWQDWEVVDDLANRLRAMNYDITQVLPPWHHPWYVTSDLDRELEALATPQAWRARVGTAAVAGTDPELRLDGDAGPFEQAAVVEWALTGVACEPSMVRPDLSRLVYKPPATTEVGFVVGGGGTGKSRVCKHIIAEYGARGMFSVVVAFSNRAAVAFERGMTVHALLGLKINEDADGNFVVRLEAYGGTVSAERDEMLKDPRCGVVIVDEGLAAKRSLCESVVLFFLERRYNVRVLINGDSEQLPPIMAFGSVADVVASSLLSSWLWSGAAAHYVLRRQHRCAADPPWAAFCATLANATAPAVEDHPFTDAAAHATAVAAPLIRNVFMHQPHDRGRHLAKNAVVWLFGLTPPGHSKGGGRLNVFRGGRDARYILVSTNPARNWWNEVIAEMRANEAASERFTYHAVNNAILKGSDADVSEDMAHEALRDEAALFEHADHSVPVSELDVGVDDLIMLPVCHHHHRRPEAPHARERAEAGVGDVRPYLPSNLRVAYRATSTRPPTW